MALLLLLAGAEEESEVAVGRSSLSAADAVGVDDDAGACLTTADDKVEPSRDRGGGGPIILFI
jgi:hypothetical protein